MSCTLAGKNFTGRGGRVADGNDRRARQAVTDTSPREAETERGTRSRKGLCSSLEPARPLARRPQTPAEGVGDDPEGRAETELVLANGGPRVGKGGDSSTGVKGRVPGNTGVE